MSELYATRCGLTSSTSTTRSSTSSGASPPSPSSTCTRSCGASTAATSTRARRCACSRPTGQHVLQGPGENAGVIGVGDGWAVAFKMESHNHPSAIEPYQGAATGVGGIIRDIFTMGARPIASLDSLRFGTLDKPRQRYLFEGSVAGIGGYGNCLGVPTVGGEVYFEEAYEGNCLINAMSIGLMREENLTRAVAAGPGNLVLLIGSTTGRDGIGGASTLASQEFDEQAEDKRPAVQVGDPFEEKLLIEACLELLDEQAARRRSATCGAAGLTQLDQRDGEPRRRRPRHRRRRRSRSARTR